MPAEKSSDKSKYKKTTKPILDDYEEETPSKSKSKSSKEPELDVNLKKSRDDSKKQSSSSRKSDFNLGESDSKSKHRTNESTSADYDKEKHRSSKNREEDREKKSSEHRRRDDDEEKESRHRRREENEENRERRHHRKGDEDESDTKDRDKDRERRHRRKEEENEDKEGRHHRKNKDDDNDRERRHRRKDEDDESREKHRSSKSNKYDDEESSSRRKKYDDDDSDRKKESSRREHRSKDEESDDKSSRKHRSSTRRDDSDQEVKKSTKKETIIEEEAAAYDDDFENDFEEDSESEKSKPPPKKEESKSKKNYSSDEDTKHKSSRSRRNNRYDYDEDEPVRIVKANALVKVPTELVECYSSKIYFNHDSLDRQQRRAKDLLKTIELDKKSFSILDIDPEMKTSFSSHLKNEKVQTNDDIFEIETQTDDIDYVTRWTQCPPEDSKGYGSEDPYNRGETVEDNILEKFRLDVNVNDLQVFLNKASKVIETILIENNSDTNRLNVENKSDLQFSQGFTRFGIPKYLSKLTKQAVLTNSCFSRDDSNYFVCSYDIQTIPDKEGKLNASLFIVWNINEPASPYKVLLCESPSTSMCYSSFMIFSGNNDGSVCVWDLRESSNLHKFNFKSKSSSESNVVRTPTYSTAGVLLNENHLSEIKSLIPLKPESKNQDQSVFMQIATLELECKLIIWTVVELSHIDLAGFETDLGLLPGGRIKLVKSSQINLNNLIRMPYGKVKYQTLAMTSPSNQANHFFICTNIGNILHIVRENETSNTTTLRSEFSENNLQVTCATFHPEVEDLLLAGYGNGELRLYHTNYFTPIKTWNFACQSKRVKDLYWLPSKNSAFLVIDETGTLYIWDLLADDTQPIYSKSLNDLGGISLSYMKQSTKASEDKESSASLPFVMYNLNSKEVDIHLFTSDWSQKIEKESKKFAKFLRNLLITF